MRRMHLVKVCTTVRNRPAEAFCAPPCRVESVMHRGRAAPSSSPEDKDLRPSVPRREATMILSHGTGRRTSRWATPFTSRCWRLKLQQHQQGRTQPAARRRRRIVGLSTRPGRHAAVNGASTTTRPTGGAPGKSQAGHARTRVTSSVPVEASNLAPRLNGRSMRIMMVTGSAGTTSTTTGGRARAHGGGHLRHTSRVLKRSRVRFLRVGGHGGERRPLSFGLAM